MAGRKEQRLFPQHLSGCTLYGRDSKKMDVAEKPSDERTLVTLQPLGSEGPCDSGDKQRVIWICLCITTTRGSNTAYWTVTKTIQICLCTPTC